MSSSYEFHQTPVDDYVRSLPPEERRQIMHDFDELQRTGISGGNTAPQGHAGILSASCIARLVSSSCLGKQKVPEARGERWFCSEKEARTAGWRAPRD